MDKKPKKEKTKTKEEVIKAAQELSTEFFELLSVDTVIEVLYDDENEAVLINIPEGDQAGLLIGNKGRTLSSIQVVFGMMLRSVLGEWHRVIFNVADWRDKEKERLEDLAEQSAQRAVETGKEQVLYNLTASQRRIVHMSLADQKDIVTESRGEGEERYLVVTPK